MIPRRKRERTGLAALRSSYPVPGRGNVAPRRGLERHGRQPPGCTGPCPRDPLVGERLLPLPVGESADDRLEPLLGRWIGRWTSTSGSRGRTLPAVLLPQSAR